MTVYPQGKRPLYKLFSSTRRTAVVPLLKNYMNFFWLFLTSTDHGGSRTSDLSIEKPRRNHFTTAPHFTSFGCCCNSLPSRSASTSLPSASVLSTWIECPLREKITSPGLNESPLGMFSTSPIRHTTRPHTLRRSA